MRTALGLLFVAAGLALGHEDACPASEGAACKAKEALRRVLESKFAVDSKRDELARQSAEGEEMPLFAASRVSLTQANASATLFEALSTTGFAVVTDHGVPQELIQDVLAQARAFHGLPESELELLKGNIKQRGYLKLTPNVRLMLIGPPDSEDVNGVNFWPNETMAPRFRNTMVDYYRQMARLERDLLILISRAMGCKEDSELYGKMGKHRGLLSLNRSIKRVMTGQCVASAHSDVGIMTILLAPEEGLQVLPLQSSRWARYPPSSTDFVVNVGNSLEYWTGGKLVSTLHRVCPAMDNRISIPYFGGNALAHSDDKLIEKASCSAVQQSSGSLNVAFEPISHRDFISEFWRLYYEKHGPSASKQ